MVLKKDGGEELLDCRYWEGTVAHARAICMCLVIFQRKTEKSFQNTPNHKNFESNKICMEYHLTPSKFQATFGKYVAEDGPCKIFWIFFAVTANWSSEV